MPLTDIHVINICACPGVPNVKKVLQLKVQQTFLIINLFWVKGPLMQDALFENSPKILTLLNYLTSQLF